MPKLNDPDMLGKLKTILKSKNKFTLYDSGENYSKLGT